MSKHHHYHQSQSSGGYHTSTGSGVVSGTTTATTKSKTRQLTEHYGNHQQQQIHHEINEMMMMSQQPQQQQQQQSSQSMNGMRLQIPNGIAQHNGGNGSSTGDVDSNDTNNNYNKHHHNHHHNHHHHHHSHHNHRDGKRSASSGSGSGSGEASSSKRSKLSVNNSNNNQSVPSNKYGSLINNHQQHQQQQQQIYDSIAMQTGNMINNNNNTNSNNNSGNNNSSNGNNNPIGGAGHYNIMEKLKDLYRELKGDKTCKELHLSSSSFLLDKLVTRERLNTLIINLYPGNKGYSLAFRVPTATTATTPTSSMPKVQQSLQSQQSQQSERETVHETSSWLYDNAHLLDALDAEELPPLLIDFCNAHCPHLYYNGAVIAQIRDYRQSYPLDICDIHYVLLRPTAAALWDEINGTVDTSWSIKERTALESQLVLATAPPMCLDPSPQIGIAAINSSTERSPIASCDGVVKMAKKFLQVTKNRNNKLEKKTHYPQLSLANHIKHQQKRDNQGTSKGAPTAPSFPLMPNDSCSNENVDIGSSFKILPIVPPSQRYDWQARNTERLTFETDRDNCQYRVRVELFERATTCEVSGQLTLERQKSGSQVSGRMCPFKLASPLAARRYVKEFMGIFTEEGRKFVKIIHERETRVGREITEMQTGEKVTATTTTLQSQPKIQTIPIIAQPAQTQPQQLIAPQLQTLQQLITSPPPASTSITSPPPPALVATTPTTLKLTAAPQRIITARPSPGQVVVLTQVKQESPGNQVIKNLLNQPRAPMTQSMVNGLALPAGQEVQTVYLQVDNSNLIHMGSAVPANLQFQQLIVPASPGTQTTPTYTMNVQTVTPQQVTVVKRHRDM